MSFTPQELALLRLSDAADGHGGCGGRPRTRPDTPSQERRRFRAKAAACGIEIDRRKGGRPRKTDGDERTAKAREQKRAYYWRKKSTHPIPQKQSEDG